jgi:hypothetical protein
MKGEMNMAATKDQERQALQQIRQIVEDLGEESYLAIAFDGVWRIASENIELDFGNSCGWYIENYHRAIDKQKQIQAESYALEAELVQKEHEMSTMEMQYEELERDYDKRIEELASASVRAMKAEEQLAAAQLKIVELKAKLYDFMVASD